jgi:hypothetical protein
VAHVRKAPAGRRTDDTGPDHEDTSHVQIPHCVFAVRLEEVSAVELESAADTNVKMTGKNCRHRRVPLH